MTSPLLRSQFPMADSIAITIATSPIWYWLIRPAQRIRINGVALSPAPGSVGHLVGCIGTLAQGGPTPTTIALPDLGGFLLGNAGGPNPTDSLVPVIDGILLGNRGRTGTATAGNYTLKAPALVLDFEFKNDWTALRQKERPVLDPQGADVLVILVAAIDNLTNYEAAFAIDALPEGELA